MLCWTLQKTSYAFLGALTFKCTQIESLLDVILYISFEVNGHIVVLRVMLYMSCDSCPTNRRLPHLLVFVEPQVWSVRQHVKADAQGSTCNRKTQGRGSFIPAVVNKTVGGRRKTRPRGNRQNSKVKKIQTSEIKKVKNTRELVHKSSIDSLAEEGGKGFGLNTPGETN